jgi:hypothetical protein
MRDGDGCDVGDKGVQQVLSDHEFVLRLFGVYSPETGKVYLIPVEDVPMGSKGLLRLQPTKNNQQKGVKWAHMYEI